MALANDVRVRLTLPVVAAPMFLCSSVELAASACCAGIMGSLTRNHCRDIQELESQLESVAERLSRFRDRHPDRRIGPLAVNISTHIVGEDMRAHLALCRRYGARVIITSVGDPSTTAPLVKDAGLLHYHDATTLRFAEKAVAAGVDGMLRSLVDDMLANSWHTNAAIKRLMMATDGMSLAQALAHEHNRYPGAAPDHAERLGKFKQG